MSPVRHLKVIWALRSSVNDRTRVETQPQYEVTQAISHQHADGEVFGASNLEAARGLCPVLGRMSLEEAGLLLELEAMGKETVPDPQQIPVERSVIEKAGRTQPNPDTSTIEISADEHISRAISETESASDAMVRITAGESNEVIPIEQVERAVQSLHSHHAEAVIAEEDTHNTDVVTANIERFAKTEPTETVAAGLHDETADLQANIELIDESAHFDMQQTAVDQTVTADESDTHQQPESQADNSPSIPQSSQPESIVTEPTIISVESPQEDELITESALFEVERTQSADLIEGSEDEVPSTYELNVDPDPGEDYGRVSASGNPELAAPGFVETDTKQMIDTPELPAPVAEIESALTQLAEVVEATGTAGDQPLKLHAIVERIIMLPASFEAAANEETPDLDQRLETLFTELFQEADIPYTAELIESFIVLTKTHYLEKLFVITDGPEQEPQGLPDEIGTREFLQKLHHGLSAMKRAVIDFYELGKSILRLYSFSFEMAT